MLAFVSIFRIERQDISISAGEAGADYLSHFVDIILLSVASCSLSKWNESRRSQLSIR
jgi:hypothetical protein